MKVFLKMKGQERYLVSPEVWTADVTEAQNFKSFLAVLDYCREHRIMNVEAVFWFEDPAYNFVLKLF